jgi:putative spermidine/putrescine transport system permease protein
MGKDVSTPSMPLFGLLAEPTGRLAVRFLMSAGIALMALPLLMTAYISVFADGVISFPPSAYTFSWYGRLFEFPRLAESLGTSLRIAGTTTVLSLVFGAPASLALVRCRFAGRGILNVLLLSPLTVPGVVLGLGLYASMVEVEIQTQFPIVGSNWGLIAAHLLIAVPWTIRLCVANLLNFDTSIEEAAASLGAWPGRVIWSVTLPVMRQAIVAAGLFSFIVSFENIEMTLFLITPGTTTFPISVLQYLEYRADPLVAAVAVAQTAVIAMLLLVVDRYAKLAKVV